MTKRKLVEAGQFCTVDSSQFTEYGVKMGDLVYLAGDALYPVTEDEPYTYRKVFVAAFTEDGHLLDKKKPFLIDGMNLVPVAEARQQSLSDLLKEDFEEDVDAEDKGGV